MALHRMGLGAEFTLNVNPAVQSANKARASVGKLKQGLTQLGMAATPVAIAFGAAAHTAAKYEQQLSAVQSVSGATTSQMKVMSKQAKMLALDTKFSHIEAAEGMEVLSRAGFEQTEMLQALRPVMDAAAADSIAMSTAADIVASSIRSMGLEATDAGRVSDVLAAASANSNTNITLLGESMRYAAAQAKTAGIDFETTVAAIGALGDSGLKGSIAGTSFANMLVKMAKPTKRGEKLLKKYKVEMKSFNNGNVDVIGTMRGFKPALEGIHNKLEKAKFVAEVFGIRGQKAVNALLNSIEKGRFEKLHQKLLNAKGTAERMAKIRLDNFIGQFTKLRKAVGVFATQLFGPALKEVTGFFTAMHDGLSKVLKASIEWQDSMSKDTAAELRKKYGIYLDIALGIQDAGEALAAGFKAIKGFLKGVGESMNKQFGEDGARKMTKYIILFGAFLAILVPLGIAATGLSMAFGGMKTTLGSLGIPPVVANLKNLIANLYAARLAAAQASGVGASKKQFGPIQQGPGSPAYLKNRDKIMTPSRRVRAGMKIRGAGSKVGGAAKGIGGALTKKRSIGGVASGIGGAFKGIGRAVKTWWPMMISGLTRLPALIMAGALAIKSAFLPALAAISPIIGVIALALAGIMILFASLGRKNESMGQTFTRVWGGIVRVASTFWSGIKEGWLPLIEEVSTQWKESMADIRLALQPLFEYLDGLMGGISLNWKMVGKTIMSVLGTIIKWSIKVIGWLATGIGIVASGFIQLCETIGEAMGFAVTNIGMLLNPIRAIVRAWIVVQEMLGNTNISQGVRDFSIKQEIDDTGAGASRDERERKRKKREKAEMLAALQRKKDQAAFDSMEKFYADKGGPMSQMAASMKEVADNTGKDKETNVNVDGKQIAKATSKNSQIDHERGGGGSDSWTRRRSYEQGS